MTEPKNLPLKQEPSDSPIWLERHEQLMQEQQTRPERLRRLCEVVDQLFTGEALAQIRARIERSFEVPQAGAHHNEGVFMDSHLEKIFNALDRVTAGQFPPNIPPEVQAMLTRVVPDPINRDLLRKYVLLHDIDKANTLNINYQDKGKQKVSWNEWQSSVPLEAKSDPVAMQQFMDAQGITSIGYYRHEEMGAATIAPDVDALGITLTVVKAIDKHGVAYNFSKIKLDTFERHFGGLTCEEMEWTVTASFIDSSASLMLNGEPDLDEFLNMCGAIHNTFVIRDLETRFKPGGQPVPELDSRKIDQGLKQLRSMEEWITDTADVLAERMRLEYQFTRYDVGQLSNKLQVEPLLTYRDQIIAAVDPSTGRLDEAALRFIRKQLGKANQMLIEALASSEIKDL